MLFRPPGSANKKKKEEKPKKMVELEPDDFDTLPPDEELVQDLDLDDPTTVWLFHLKSSHDVRKIFNSDIHFVLKLL